MPFASERQRKFIYARAAAGEPWARRFIKHSGHTPPRKRKRLRDYIR